VRCGGSPARSRNEFYFAPLRDDGSIGGKRVAVPSQQKSDTALRNKTWRDILTFRLALAVGTAFVVGLGAWGAVQAKQEKGGAPQTASEIRPAPAFGKKALKNGTTEGWITNGRTVFNQRYAPLDQINRDNVKNLKGVWHIHLNGSGIGPKYSGEAQPIVYDGVIYISTGENDVFAVSVETGKILWTYKSHLDQKNNAVCCGWTSRGVGLGDGKVFVGRLDGKLVALDQKTGKVVWSIQAERWQDKYTITNAPLYYDGKVIIGFAGGEYNIRGRVKAYDAKTGKLIWTFYAIPGPGEPGHETWPKDSDAWKHGGAPLWQTPAVDPDLGMIYFSTGNASPDFDGSGRPGDNLYTASIVALDVKTGKYKWHFQEVHHDIWDYDAPNPVILFDTKVDGKMRKGIAQASKTGWVYILDRETGKPLVGMEEKPVPQEPRHATAATQPYPVGDAFVPHEIPMDLEKYDLVNHGRIFTPYYGDKRIPITPSLAGGANWPPSSYDPETHTFYVCASQQIQFFHSGGVAGGPEMAPQKALGILAAIDVTTNKLVWRRQWAEQCYSGTAVTKGGLLFLGRNDGRFMAFDKANGKPLWEFQTGAGANASPSIFEYKGREMVVAYSAGNLIMGSKRGDDLWLFALDGTLGPITQEEMAAAAAKKAGTAGKTNLASLKGNAERGGQVYANGCVFCHGPKGYGTHGGKSLKEMLSIPVITSVVVNGRNDMPAFKGILSDQDIVDVANYIVDVLNKDEAASAK
jgi:quinohemoprotein ethanol dehydrogenase